MTEPQKPGEGESAPYTLPSWIDNAIARSKGDEVSTPETPAPEAEPSVSDDADTQEYLAVPAAPPREAPRAGDAPEVVPSFLGLGSTEGKHVKYPVVPETPMVRAEREAAAESATPELEAEVDAEIDPAPRSGALPWVIAALFLAAAALVLAYLIWMRPVPA